MARFSGSGYHRLAMDIRELDKMLRQTLEDRRMSRSERRALREVLDEAMLDDDELAVARALAFSLARDADLDPRAKQVLGWLEEAIQHSPA